MKNENEIIGGLVRAMRDAEEKILMDALCDVLAGSAGRLPGTGAITAVYQRRKFATESSFKGLCRDDYLSCFAKEIAL